MELREVVGMDFNILEATENQKDVLRAKYTLACTRANNGKRV